MLLHLKEEALAREQLGLAVQAEPDLTAAQELLAQLNKNLVEGKPAQESRGPVVPAVFESTEEDKP
jgi:hypothetical protein